MKVMRCSIGAEIGNIIKLVYTVKFKHKRHWCQVLYITVRSAVQSYSFVCDLKQEGHHRKLNRINRLDERDIEIRYFVFVNCVRDRDSDQTLVYILTNVFTQVLGR